MFTIIGGDGKEYGPVTVDQVRAWIAAGRANLDTQAKAQGSDEWRRLGDYPEFTAGTVEPPVVSAPMPGVAVGTANLADRLQRLGAWLLDQILAFLCCLPGFVLVGFSVIGAVMRGGSIDEVVTGQSLLGWVLLVIGGLVLLVIQVWLLTTRGQTVGKRLMGIRIVRLSDGSNPGFVSAVLLRSVVPGVLGMVPYLGFIFTIVDICFIFREDRRCIHDLIATTRVVKVEPVTGSK